MSTRAIALDGEIPAAPAQSPSAQTQLPQEVLTVELLSDAGQVLASTLLFVDERADGLYTPARTSTVVAMNTGSGRVLRCKRVSTHDIYEIAHPVAWRAIKGRTVMFAWPDNGRIVDFVAPGTPCVDEIDLAATESVSLSVSESASATPSSSMELSASSSWDGTDESWG